MAKDVTLDEFKEGEQLGAGKLNKMRKALQQMQAFQGGFASGGLALTRKTLTEDGLSTSSRNVWAVVSDDTLEEPIAAASIDLEAADGIEATPGESTDSLAAIMDWELDEDLEYKIPLVKLVQVREDPEDPGSPFVYATCMNPSATPFNVPKGGVLVPGYLFTVLDENDKEIEKTFMLWNTDPRHFPNFDKDKLQILYHPKANGSEGDEDYASGIDFRLDAEDCATSPPPTNP